MTVEELIKALEAQPPDAMVFYGNALDLRTVQSVDRDRMTIQAVKREIVILS